MPPPSRNRSRIVAYVVLFLVALGATALMVDENANLNARGILALAGITTIGYMVIWRLFPKDDDQG